MFSRRMRRGNPGDATIGAIDTAITERARTGFGEPNSKVAAGYTYLGQFIDHDLTFDATPAFERYDAERPVANLRTPRFDLDSLYGRGRIDQPYLYDGVKLLVGRNPSDTDADDDLPRNQRGRALIGDPRNDENLITAQLHLVFIRFHNRVVDWLGEREPDLKGDALFAEAQRLVRWHYQWIVIHDYLARLGGPGASDTFREGPDAWHTRPFIPREFSGAAFRFGHSMVRPFYKLNDEIRNIKVFADKGEDLHGFRRLPASLEIAWEHFFELTDTNNAERSNPQDSWRIDLDIAPALAALPIELDPRGRSLPLLNLERGRTLDLPSGRSVARSLKERGLTDAQLTAPLDDAGLDPTHADRLRKHTPLWYYILCEAATQKYPDGKRYTHLGRVGGRIVAKVFYGLLHADPTSYMNANEPWTPDFAENGQFKMPQLIRFALDL